ncbi:hypothetical protein B0H67DRAFT_306140, partial [Lasiosphaeris hirsuta]
MRLINSTTLQIEEFLGDQAPEYAILFSNMGRGRCYLDGDTDGTRAIGNESGLHQSPEVRPVSPEERASVHLG